jgi:hypothetical protein
VQAEHQALDELDWHSAEVAQFSVTCHEPQTRFVVPQVALDPVQYLYWFRRRASDPQVVPVHPYSVAYALASHW